MPAYGNSDHWYRLQFNLTGAWRNAVDAPAERLLECMDAAVPLARIVQAKIRVLNPDGSVRSYWTAELGWQDLVIER